LTLPTNLKFATATPGSPAGSATGWTSTATCAATGFGAYADTLYGRTRRAEKFTLWWRPNALFAPFTSNGTTTLTTGLPIPNGTTVVIVGNPLPSPLANDPSAIVNGTAASVQSAAQPFALADGQQFSLSVQGSNVVAWGAHTSDYVTIGAATAAEVAQSMAAFLKPYGGTATAAGGRVTIVSGVVGSSSELDVVGGTAALGFPLGPATGTGNVANVAAVTDAERAVLALAVVYFVVNASSGSFGLATTEGGPAITVASGSGVAIEPPSGWYVEGLTLTGIAPSAAQGQYVTGKDSAGGPVRTGAENFAAWLPGLDAYVFQGPNDPANLAGGQYGAVAGLTAGRAAETFGPSALATYFAVVSPPTQTLTVTSGPVPAVGAGMYIETSGTLPSPGVVLTPYFCVARDPIAGTFEISASVGGSPVTWTTAGTGRQNTNSADGWFAGQHQYRMGGFIPGDIVTGMYDGGTNPVENFSNWTTGLASNYRGLTGGGFLSGDTLPGLYNGGLDTAESFLSAIPGTWSVAPTTTNMTCAGVAPVVGAPLQFSTTGTLPAAVDLTSVWWVVYSSGPIVRVSATRGGGAVTFTDAGTGTHSLAAHPSYGWPYGGYV
jgi:hypothetical protein